MMLFFVSRETMKYNKYVIEFNCNLYLKDTERFTAFLVKEKG